VYAVEIGVTPSQLYTLQIIIDYIEWRNRRLNKNSRCFKYKTLKRWFLGSKHSNYILWRTVERNIRHLCNLGYIERKGRNRRRETIFCITEKGIKLVEDYVGRFKTQ